MGAPREALFISSTCLVCFTVFCLTSLLQVDLLVVTMLCKSQKAAVVNKLVHALFVLLELCLWHKFLHRESLDQKVNMCGLLFSFAKFFSIRVTLFGVLRGSL